ncbi:MAG: energy-coupling factor transporter transmembrane protein EcfT [Treponema sp.]|nr:energy-coupling factor transporter transmembrane protein EcfT [Treponema sp.]
MARIKKDRGGIERRAPYSYRPGDSALHRLPGWVKLLTLLGISTAAFFAGFPALAAGAIIVTAGALSAGIRPWELLRGGKPLFIMIFFIVPLRSIAYDPLMFNVPGCREALLFGGTILVSFSAGALLFSVTTMTELMDSLSKIERVLCLPLAVMLKKKRSPRTRRLLRRLEQPRLSLGISLMLGFLPRFFEVWESVTAAYRARAGKGGVSQMLTVIPPVIEHMIAKAGETASALESRGLTLRY